MAETVVYEGASPDSMSHTICRHDGTRLTVHDSYLRLKIQPGLSNITSTALAFRNEFDVGISKEEAQALARPRILTSIQQELMDWHHRMYHLSFPKICRLAELVHLPKRLLDCKKNSPLCVACQFGTAHRRTWRTKGKASGSIRAADHVETGYGVLMDKIVSAQPGIIPHMSGFLTSRITWGCTMFCDHLYDFLYVHLMQDFTVEETLLAVKAFEKTLAKADRLVTHYHADNGIFATFFCPVYVLDSRAQSAGGPGLPKWEPRCRIGVYLGHSPFHAGSVALVFNPTTGLVSTQFHVVFDESFSTVL